MGLLLGLALTLAACSNREGGPAPLVNGNNQSDLGNGGFGYGGAGGPALRETGGGTVTVARGQTLYAVARAQNVPVRSLIDANHLQPPYHIQVGDRLVVPHIREHIVQPGETLYAVSRRYGVEASTLAQTNHLEPPYNIRVGTPLILPPAVEAPATSIASAAPISGGPISGGPISARPLSGSPFSGSPLPPPTPLVPPGSAARQQALTAKPGTLAAPKPLPGGPAATSTGAPIPLTPPGETAGTPASTEAPAATPPAAASPATSPATGQATPGQLTPPAGAKPAPQTPAEPEEQATGAAAAPAPTASATVASIVANHPQPTSPIFYWPVRGKIISVFGPAAGGMHNDGINIVAPEGTTVSAAENGVVAYAGNELKGFGNLLLIKHSGGWITAYAHNKMLLVKKGDHVRRGQPIAQVGETGGVSQPQLHFEIRQGTKAIDPLDHLPALSGNG
jgi:murein DD-endopeptidase MepM/ murein hydrolase activator NlpD